MNPAFFSRFTTVVSLGMVVFLSCTSSPPSDPAPGWTKDLPSDPCYFYGRAKVPRSDNLDDDLNAARNEALSNIRQQISVVISSEGKYMVEEKGRDFRSQFIKETVARVPEMELIHYEQVGDTWKTGAHLYVLYRLSKPKFYNRLYGDLKNAVDRALAVFQEGEAGSSAERFTGYTEALGMLIPYHGIDVTYNACGENVSAGVFRNLDGRRQALDFAVADRLKAMVKDKVIEAERTVLIFKGDRTEMDIRVRVTSGGKPAAGFPLQLDVPEPGWKYQSGVTTEMDGTAVFRLLEDGLPGRWRIRVEPAHGQDALLDSLYGLGMPFVTVELERAAPKVWMDIKESNSGGPSDVYGPILKEGLLKLGAVELVTRKEAEIILTGMATARDDGIERGRFSRAAVLVELEMKSAGGKTAEYKNSSIRGLKISDLKGAGEDGLRKAAAADLSAIIKVLLDLHARK